MTSSPFLPPPLPQTSSDTVPQQLIPNPLISKQNKSPQLNPHHHVPIHRHTLLLRLPRKPHPDLLHRPNLLPGRRRPVLDTVWELRRVSGCHWWCWCWCGSVGLDWGGRGWWRLRGEEISVAVRRRRGGSYGNKLIMASLTVWWCGFSDAGEGIVWRFEGLIGLYVTI